ncbi:hypothetical protein TrVGV298_001617 [Trichoderma virens]|nr:hypothetical protein TrVGV298_001617 [Trichoderma virens]
MTPYSDQDAHSRFGCLYNLTVDILPKPKSSLLQTTCLQQFPTTIWSATPGVLGSPTYNLASDMYGDRDEDGEDDKRNKGKDQKHGAAGDDGGKKNAGLWTWATWF